MSATLTTLSSSPLSLRLRSAAASPAPAPPAPAPAPVPPALVARKLRDLSDLAVRLDEAAALSAKRGDATREASYIAQAAAARTELAQWRAIQVNSSAVPSSSTSSTWSPALPAAWPAALCVLLLPLLSALCTAIHAVARRRAAQAALVLALLLSALQLTASSTPLNLAALQSLSLSLPSCSDDEGDAEADDASAASPPTKPRHWAHALAAGVLRRKSGATPDLRHAMRTRR